MSEERVCLDFLLTELRLWHTEGRVPETFLAPLYDEYTARRKALAPPRLEMYDLEPDRAPHPPSAPQPTARPSLALITEHMPFLSADDRDWILRRTADSVFFRP